MPLRIRVLAASGLGVYALSVESFEAAAVFAVMMTVVVATVGAHHPFARFGPANCVTMLRAATVATVAALLPDPPSERLAWFVVGATVGVAALDGLDGWLARRTGLASAFGARFDMEVDALLILVMSLFVWLHDKAGAWVVLCGVMRYAFVVAGWVLPWMAGPLSPTLRGKTVAVGQVLGLGVALAPVVPSPLSAIVAAITLAALAWSFAIDVGRLWRGR